MAVPTNKEELLEAIAKNYRLLMLQVDRFPISQAKLKLMEGHAQNSEMSLHDLLAYLVGWGKLVLKWQENYKNTEAIDFPETGYKWNELGKLAQKFYRDYEQYSFLELKQLLEFTVLSIQKNIGLLANAELYETEWYGKWTLGRMIQFNTASPYNNARGRVSKYLKNNIR